MDMKKSFLESDECAADSIKEPTMAFSASTISLPRRLLLFYSLKGYSDGTFFGADVAFLPLIPGIPPSNLPPAVDSIAAVIPTVAADTFTSVIQLRAYSGTTSYSFIPKEALMINFLTASVPCPLVGIFQLLGKLASFIPSYSIPNSVYSAIRHILAPEEGVPVGK